MKTEKLDVFLVDMALANLHLEPFAHILNEMEEIKARKFVRPQDARNYRVHKILEKLLLSRYLSCSVEEVLLKYSSTGGPMCYGSISYSKSHSGNLVIFAFTKFDVGIDLEEITDHENNLLLMDILHPEESFSPNDFFKVWTQKEAYLKFIGTGLNLPMSSVKLTVENEGHVGARGVGRYAPAQVSEILLTSHPSFVCHVSFPNEVSLQINFHDHEQTIDFVLI